jgi:hypothetical protein
VGTNAANLSNSNCSFTDGSSIMVSVVQCPGVLEGSIISFSGKINYEGKAVLNWIVSNETNVLKYEIEKSADGTQFFKSGAQPSKNSAGFAEYYFTDEALAKSSNYFRLKIYRTSGSFKYSETILLNNNHNGIMIVGYSNPFTNAISFNYLLPANGKVKIIITDAMGKALYVQTLAGKKELNNFALNCLDFIAAGIYNITLYYDNTLVTKRLLKTD